MVPFLLWFHLYLGRNVKGLMRAFKPKARDIPRFDVSVAKLPLQLPPNCPHLHLEPGGRPGANQNFKEVDMNKTLIAVVIAAVAIFGGYKWYSGQQAMVAEEKAATEAMVAEEAAKAEAMAAEEAAKAEAMAAEEAAKAEAMAAEAAAKAEAMAAEAAAAAAAASTAVTEATEAATEAATTAVEGAMEAVGDVVTDIVGESEAVTEALGAATEAATDAVAGAVEDAAGAATDAVTGTVAEATEAAADTAEAATETATEATEAAAEATEAAPMTAMDMAKTLLTPEGFDAGKVGELIDGSNLGDVQKLALKTGVEQAANNPDMLKAVLDQVKAALGM